MELEIIVGKQKGTREGGIEHYFSPPTISSVPPDFEEVPVKIGSEFPNDGKPSDEVYHPASRGINSRMPPGAVEEGLAPGESMPSYVAVSKDGLFPEKYRNVLRSVSENGTNLSAQDLALLREGRKRGLILRSDIESAYTRYKEATGKGVTDRYRENRERRAGLKLVS